MTLEHPKYDDWSIVLLHSRLLNWYWALTPSTKKIESHQDPTPMQVIKIIKFFNLQAVLEICVQNCALLELRGPGWSRYVQF